MQCYNKSAIKGYASKVSEKHVIVYCLSTNLAYIATIANTLESDK